MFIKTIQQLIRSFLQFILKFCNFAGIKQYEMPQKLIQTQTQTQTQTLTPQQLLQVHLLELPLKDFEERVNEELLENEALEQGSDDEERDNGEFDGEESYDDGKAQEADALADYVSDDETPDYLLARASASENSGNRLPFGQSVSLYEELNAQIAENDLTDHEKEVMVYLIGSLDSDGFLRKDTARIADELAIYHNIETTPDELGHLIKILQTFEPRGIGARSLQECLHIQLASPEFTSPLRELELEVIDKYYDDFTHKRWEKIRQRLGTDAETIDRIRTEIQRLNPRPGSSLNETAATAAQEITPDFTVENDGRGNLSVTLNEGEVPPLRVSESFRSTIKEFAGNRSKLTRSQKDTYTYTRQKIEAAQTFIDAVRRRQNNMLATMKAIVEFQKPFFTEGDDTLLRPMILRDIAERTGLDISTISRVSNSKYVETDFGIFPLKYFFNDKFVTDEGDVHSTLKIRKALADIINSENKKSPLSDETLAARLKEQGFPVARRTVAKYREQMGIPVARLRK